LFNKYAQIVVAGDMVVASGRDKQSEEDRCGNEEGFKRWRILAEGTELEEAKVEGSQKEEESGAGASRTAAGGIQRSYSIGW